MIGAIICGKLALFVHDHKLGIVTGANGGYIIMEDRYVPNAAFISKKRQPQLQSIEGYNPLPPDLAVEVISPSCTPQETRIKVINYLTAGTVVWLFDPENREVEIYIPGQRGKILGMDGVIDGGDVLPGFRLAVKDVFLE